MQRLSEISQRRLNQHKMGAVGQASHVVFTAKQWLDDRLKADASSIRPFRFKEGVLWLGVEHSAWAQEAHAIARFLLKDLQSAHGLKVVRQIRIKSLTSS